MQTRIVCVALVLSTASVFAADPKLGTSTISLGAGVAFPASGYRTSQFHTGPAVTGEYEVHLHRFVAATVGIENYLLSAEQFGRFRKPNARERVTLLPVSLRGIVPFAAGRGEFFLGSGGAPYWSTNYDLGNSFRKDAVLWHINGGFRVSLDRQGRFRLGPTFRHYRDVGRPTQQWVSLTAEFSYRFGSR